MPVGEINFWRIILQKSSWLSRQSNLLPIGPSINLTSINKEE